MQMSIPRCISDMGGFPVIHSAKFNIRLRLVRIDIAGHL